VKTTRSIEEKAKHRRIYADIRADLVDGRYGDGERLPTETELAATYGVSRPTVTKALNNLKKEGLIIRRTGSGTFVRLTVPRSAAHALFGLLIPSLGKGEIFEPICAQIASLSAEKNFSLLWGGSASRGSARHASLEHAVERYIENNVTGVFFAPLELDPEFEGINLRVISLLQAARLPTVLIDTDYLPFPQRGSFDLIGIDNFQAGYVVTAHLISHDRQRVDFLHRPNSSFTIALRMRGFREALWDAGVPCQSSWVHSGDPGERDFVRGEILDRGATDIVCGNDETAAQLLRTLERLGVQVPEKVRIAGFDDVYYAQHLSVPLTTIHQPCRDLGTAAVELMLSRLHDPLRATRTVTIPGALILRESCGSHERARSSRDG
jgi:GntR family transcriptional regulator of arabinose operon